MIGYLQQHNILAPHVQLIHHNILERDEYFFCHPGLDPGSYTKEKSLQTDHHSELIERSHIEKDPELNSGWQHNTQSWQAIDKQKTLIVWNLPYYITSPILRKFFDWPKSRRAWGVFLIQKEVAERLASNANRKSYLWRLINFAHEVTYCFDVPAEAFEPAPKVTSAVIAITPKSVSDIPSLDYDKLLTFLDLYSPYKRKTLGKIAKMLAKRNIDDTSTLENFQSQRLEELSWDDLAQILK